MNNSGITPALDRIVILPEPLEEVSDGGIVIPDTVNAEHGLAQFFGTLIAVGPDCWTDYSQPAAKVGDRVMYAKYTGAYVVGEDGISYRLMNDRDITATCTEGVSYSALRARKPLGERND